MILFPYSFIDKAKDWYLDQPTQIMTNWNILEENFPNRFFLHNEFLDAKTAIIMFSQGSTETLCESCERFKSMLRKCPSRGFDDITYMN